MPHVFRFASRSFAPLLFTAALLASCSDDGDKTPLRAPGDETPEATAVASGRAPDTGSGGIPAPGSDRLGSVAEIAESAGKSIVRVGLNCQPGNPTLCEGVGTGWVFDDQGHIVTNNHVVAGETTQASTQAAGELTISAPDGRQLPASIVGTDPRTDLAVLKVEAKDMPPLELGELDETRVGDPVVAIGFALDLGATPSVTTGVISAKERELQEVASTIYGTIQTDAAINPGNSGGPLLNMRGEVLGVNTAIASQATGIGFAVSEKTVRAVVKELLESGTVDRGFVGILFREVTPAMAEQSKLPVKYGVLVERVGEGTPAAGAGLQDNDVIVKLAGREIRNGSDLPLAVIGHGPGEKVEIEYYRGGDKKNATITLGELATTAR